MPQNIGTWTQSIYFKSDQFGYVGAGMVQSV
jgi:hypothetical protein